jgi:hypothetical protein
MRRAARVDSNHSTIRKAFRKLGYVVADTSRLGNGFPDLVISANLITALVEVKDGAKVASARQLTEDEKQFRDNWDGLYFIVETLNDVIKVHVEMTREWQLRMRGMNPIVDAYTRGYA